jgi:low affinity Fe/Cu permease
MVIDKTITFGNIVSWIMILTGLGFGYAKLISAGEHNTLAVAQNKVDVQNAVLLAQKVADDTRTMDAKRDAQINSLTVAVAVTRVTLENMDKNLGNMDKKIDELIRRKESANE